MKNPNLLNLLENTVKCHEGFSYNIYNGECNPQTGYMVALRGFQREVTKSESIVQTGREYMLNYAEMLVNTDNFMGCWVADDRVMFDVSIHLNDLTDAIRQADINEQEAIWDCANNVEIYLDSPKARLELIRIELRGERISYGELAELQSLIEHIGPEDIELLEAADVPENQR